MNDLTEKIQDAVNKTTNPDAAVEWLEHMCPCLWDEYPDSYIRKCVKEVSTGEKPKEVQGASEATERMVERLRTILEHVPCELLEEVELLVEEFECDVTSMVDDHNEGV